MTCVACTYSSHFVFHIPTGAISQRHVSNYHPPNLRHIAGARSNWHFQRIINSERELFTKTKPCCCYFVRLVCESCDSCVVKDTVLVVFDFAEELGRERLESLVAQAVVDDRLRVLLRQTLLPDRVRPGRREGTC